MRDVIDVLILRVMGRDEEVDAGAPQVVGERGNTGRNLALELACASNGMSTQGMRHVRESRPSVPVGGAFIAILLATACSVDVSKLRARPLVDSGARAEDARESGAMEADAREADAMEADAREADAREADAMEADARDTYLTEVDALLDHPLDQDLGVQDSFVEVVADEASASPEVDDVAEAEDLAEAGDDVRADLLLGTGGTFDTGGAGGAGGGGTGGTGGMAGIDGATATGGTGGTFATGGAGGAGGGGTGGTGGIDGATATGGTGGSVTLPAGLVGWWKMDEEAGSGTAADASGNGNNATLTGLNSASAWTTGHTGGALNCDGSGGALVNDSASLDGITTGVTISAWVYRSTATTGYSAVLSRETGTTGGDLYDLGLSGDNAGFYGSAGGVFSTTAVPIGTWTHLAVTSEGSAARVYVNGTQVTSRNSSAVFRADTSKVVICGNQNDASGAIQERWNGLVDDLQLYNRALTATEITNLAK